jgi:hypothetical protein
MTSDLDEIALRTPDWSPGTWVRLADGRDWSLPPVPVEWRWRTLLDGRLDLQPQWAPGLFVQVVGLASASNPWAVYHRLAQVGTLLLQENYWLTGGQCEALLPFDPTRPGFAGTLGAIEAGDTSAIAAALAIGEHVRPALETFLRWRRGVTPPIAADAGP